MAIVTAYPLVERPSSSAEDEVSSAVELMGRMLARCARRFQGFPQAVLGALLPETAFKKRNVVEAIRKEVVRASSTFLTSRVVHHWHGVKYCGNNVMSLDSKANVPSAYLRVF